MKVLAALVLTLQLLPSQATAPRIMGFSVQGTSVNLDYFKGKKSVVVVFYRTQN